MSEPRTWAVLDEDGEPGDEIELYQHRPDTTDGLVNWTGGDLLFVNGGPVVLVPGHRPVADRLVGLGDYAARSGKGFRAERGDGIGQRYTEPAGG